MDQYQKHDLSIGIRAQPHAANDKWEVYRSCIVFNSTNHSSLAELVAKLLASKVRIQAVGGVVARWGACQKPDGMVLVQYRAA